MLRDDAVSAFLMPSFYQRSNAMRINPDGSVSHLIGSEMELLKSRFFCVTWKESYPMQSFLTKKEARMDNTKNYPAVKF
jgi:hypothetical protein